MLFDIRRTSPLTEGVDSVTLQEDFKISLEWKRRLWHVFVSTFLGFAHGRRIIGFYNNRAHPESAYHSRTVDSIHRRLHMGCWNPIHLLFPDLYIPDQEWRISVQIVPVDRPRICYKIIHSVGMNLH